MEVALAVAVMSMPGGLSKESTTSQVILKPVGEILPDLSFLSVKCEVDCVPFIISLHSLPWDNCTFYR